MPQILLHQYDSSPFSEKVRVCLGIKGLSWAAVDQPVIMPKPDLIPLTGGYRRIPVMQIGADIYCDSQLIVRELERRFPETTLYPTGDAGLSQALQLWADRQLFGAAVAVIFGGRMGGEVPEAFRKDREQLSGRPFDPAAMAAGVPIMKEQLRAHLAWIDEQLADGRAFITGAKPGLADAVAFYNLWFVRAGAPEAAGPIDALPRITAWEGRVRGIGHGDRTDISSEEAIAIAKAAEPEAGPGVDPGEPNLKAGQTVRVMADDYGRDPIEGVLVSSTPHEVAIRREHERVGAIVCHFPRVGFLTLPA